VSGPNDDLLLAYLDTLFTKRIHSTFADDYKFTAANIWLLDFVNRTENMSSIKEELLDAGLDITFTCPSCGDVIEAEVQDTCFDWTNDSLSDGISSVITDIGCPHCDREYGVEVVAKPGEKDVNVLRHPHTEVKFRDNTFD